MVVVETSKPMTDPKQILLSRVASLMDRTSAAILWKYTDEEGKDFYLTEKRTGTVRSPQSGKSFTAKPERFSLSDVGKELKEDGSKTKGALWKYTDDAGKVFYLSERVTGTLKSPYDGKSFSAKAEKDQLGEVSKDLKQEADKTAFEVSAALTKAEQKVVDAFYEHQEAEGGMLTTDGKVLEKNGMGGHDFAKWEGGKIVVNPDRPTVKNDEEILRYMKKSIPAGSLAPHSWFGKAKKASAEALDILNQGTEHPAITHIRNAFQEVLTGLSEAQGRKTASGSSDPNYVLECVVPKIRNLGREATIVAKQLEEYLG